MFLKFSSSTNIMVNKFNKLNLFEINVKVVEISNFYFDYFCQESLEELINHLFFSKKKKT